MTETPTTYAVVTSEKYVTIPLKDLPEVKRDGGCYETPGYCRPYDYKREQLDHAIRGLLAVRLAMSEDDAKAEQEAKEAEAKQAHDALRTSPIALKALALYNKSMYASYPRWDDTSEGYGAPDKEVRWWIKQAEKQEAERLTARRDQLVQDHVGHPATYDTAYPSTRSFVDRIIELEDSLTELKVQA
jgi:hypothetical protein